MNLVKDEITDMISEMLEFKSKNNEYDKELRCVISTYSMGEEFTGYVKLAYIYINKKNQRVCGIDYDEKTERDGCHFIKEYNGLSSNHYYSLKNEEELNKVVNRVKSNNLEKINEAYSKPYIKADDFIEGGIYYEDFVEFYKESKTLDSSKFPKKLL